MCVQDEYEAGHGRVCVSSCVGVRVYILVRSDAGLWPRRSSRELQGRCCGSVGAERVLRVVARRARGLAS